MLSKFSTACALSFLLCALTSAPAFGAVIFSGGPVVTHPGGMTGAAAGADRSAVSPGATAFGYGASAAGNIRLADDFTITQNFTINSIQLIGYKGGAVTPGAIGMTVRIFSGGPPGLGTLVFGDTTTNILTSTGWLGGTGSSPGVYRTTTSDTEGTTRRLQEMTAGGLNISLPAGTYWLDYNFSGDPDVTPPVSSPTSIVAGNAMQSTNNGATFAPLLDGATQVALPFILNGTVVPEPGTFTLLALAIPAGLAIRRRNPRAAK